MAIIQCPRQHYYDDRREAQCPYCRQEDAGIGQDEYDFNEQQTIYADFPPDYDDEAQLTQGYGEDIQEEDRTIGMYSIAAGNLLTVGWLVCTEGLARGKSYPLYSGRNFGGRSPDSDMAIYDDLQLSRLKHFSVVYDPRSVQFFVVAESGTVHLNGVLIQQAEKLQEGDRIEVAQDEFVFIPYCREGRTWE